jgi:hypothetical protein
LPEIGFGCSICGLNLEEIVMNIENEPHPTLKDLKQEIGEVLVYWSFLETEIRRQLKSAGLNADISKGPIISHWRAYVQQRAKQSGNELVEWFWDPVEKAAISRNLIAHGIHSLSADPRKAGDPEIVCRSLDGKMHSLSIVALRKLSEDIDHIRRSIVSFPVPLKRPG